MEKIKKTGFWANFKHFFFRGLAAVLPSLLSLVLIIKGYQFIDQYVGYYVSWAIIRLIAYARLWIFGGTIAGHIDTLNLIWVKWYLHIGGFIIAISLIYFVGVFLTSFVGRWIWRLAEAFLNRTPVVGQIYPHVKQVTDFFLSEKRLQYSQVIALEYPRKGIWSLGLLTGEAPKDIRKHLGDDLVSIFIPSSPTPLTGYVVCVRESEIIKLAIPIEDAFRFIISGGLLKPSKFLNGKASFADQIVAGDSYPGAEAPDKADEKNPKEQT